MLLPKLSAQSPIVTPERKPTSGFLEFMEQTRKAQEATDARQDQVDADAAVTLALLQAQIARITRGFIAISHTDGLTLTAEASGATAKAVISDHTRVYIDLSVSVDGADLAGLSYGETYSIYYDDADREGGAVSYSATLDPTQAVTSSTHPTRHLVGVVTAPATAGDPPNNGGGTRPPGFPPGDLYLEP